MPPNMTPPEGSDDVWARGPTTEAERIFHDALQHEPDRWRAFVAERCAGNAQLAEEVLSLLQHADTTDAILSDFRSSWMPMVRGSDEVAESADVVAMPQTIGQFTIVEELGRGGMGVVYRARQQKPARFVALKLIRADALSPDTLRRFEFETETLGRLSHPSIARIYEAGFAQVDGMKRPFFAMELVSGLPIEEFVSKRTMPTEEVLKLALKLCDAVQFAHQQGVIHRDLKPENILVDDAGDPKVVDFGIARTVSADAPDAHTRTQQGQIFGTPAYMSPEQLSGDSSAVDTRSDVYALGVVIYRMLTQSPPYDYESDSMFSTARAVLDQEAIPIRKRSPGLSRDVETILAKALAKRKEERYDSAAGLAADIRRYLRDEPIVARPATRLYLLSRFARRNRAWVAGLSLALVALVAGLAGTTYGLFWALDAEGRATQRAADAEISANRAQEATVEAEQSARRAEEVVRFLVDTLGAADPRVDGFEVRVVDRLEAALGGLEAAFPDDAQIRARLQSAIGQTLHALGRLEVAEAALAQAAKNVEAELGETDPRTISALNDHAQALQSLGRYEQAGALYRRAVSLQRTALPANAEEATTLRHNYAGLLRLLGRYDEAVPLLRETLDAFERALGPHDARTLSAKNNLASLLSELNRNAEALPLYLDVLTGCLAQFGELDPRTLITRSNLSTLYFDVGETEKALEQHRILDELGPQVLPSDHPMLMNWKNSYAMFLLDIDQLEDAEAEMRTIIAQVGPVAEARTRDDLTKHRNLALVLLRQHRVDEAAAIMESILARAGEVLPLDDHAWGMHYRTRARAELLSGRVEAARRFAQQSLDHYAKTIGLDHPDARQTQRLLDEVSLAAESPTPTD